MIRLLHNPVHLPASLRAFHYGDGLFETILVRRGCCHNLDAHWERLSKGLLRLGYLSSGEECEFATAGLTTQLNAILLDVDPEQDYVLKVIVSPQQDRRGYARDPSAELLALSFISPHKFNQSAVSLDIAPEPCVVQPSLQGIKHLNCLSSVMALQGKPSDFDDILLRNEHNQLIESSSANLLYSFDGELWYYPPLDSVFVIGTMLMRIISLAERLGKVIEPRPLAISELDRLVAMSLSSSLVGARPVKSILSQPLRLTDFQVKLHELSVDISC